MKISECISKQSSDIGANVIRTQNNQPHVEHKNNFYNIQKYVGGKKLILI